MTYYPYILTLHAPLIISHRGGDPNSTDTYNYIPGASVRGAVAQALGDPGGRNDKLAEFRTLVLSGRVRYLNAYPVIAGRRALPVPFSFRMAKGAVQVNKTLNVIDLAAFNGDDWPDQELTTLPHPYISLGAASIEVAAPSIGSRVHHQRDRLYGRAWKEQYHDGKIVSHGAVYTYNFLEAEQQFGGVIQISCTEEDELRLIERVKECLVSPIILGRSRRSGYGGEAEITWQGSTPRELSGSRVLSKGPVEGDVFRLLLLSPCLVRDSETGQMDPSAFERELIGCFQNAVKIVCKRQSFTIIGSFNRKWRLETPQSHALAGGTVIVLKAVRKIPLNNILKIEHDGFGERLSEGFGRVVFLDEPTRHVRAELYRDSALINLEDLTPSTVARLMERRLLKRAMQNEIERAAARVIGAIANKDSIPASSLLSKLRLPLRGDSPSGLSCLRTWLGKEDGSLRPHALRQLDHCRIQFSKVYSVTLRNWITALLSSDSEEERENIEELLGFNKISQKYLITQETAKQTILEFKSTLIARLLDHVLADMIKLNKMY